MKKFYQKKEVPLEKTPILLRLERRHTLMEGNQDSSKERQASRANSVGSASGTASSVSTPEEKCRISSSQKCMSDDKKSIFSTASTVVITESELSSSWLYNSQKAQIASSIETNPDFKSGMASNISDNLEQGTRPDPRPKPSEPARSSKQTSCCCYLTIALFICLASLGILAAIGGIIYMELFAGYVENGHHSTLDLVRSQGVQVNMVNSSIVKGHNDVERILDETLQKGITGVPVGGIGLPGRIESNTSSSSKTDHSESNSTLSEFSQVSNEKDSISIPHGKVDGQSNKSLEVLPDTLTNNENLDEVTKELSDQEKLDLFMKFNEAVNRHFFVNESQVPRDLHADPNSTSDIEMEQHDGFVNQELDDSFENSSYSGNDSVVNNWQDPITSDPLDSNSLNESLPIIRDHLAYLPVDVTMNISTNKVNVPEAEFDFPNENSNHSMDFKTDLLPPTNVSDGKETSDDIVKKVSNMIGSDGSSNDSTSGQETANPTTEKKGVPFEFFRRLGFNEASLSAHPALTVEDMNVKFSLAEALKYLRSLDTNNKLPTSRQKSDINHNNRSPKKLADAGKEREEYLTKLRENLYS